MGSVQDGEAAQKAVAQQVGETAKPTHCRARGDHILHGSPLDVALTGLFELQSDVKPWRKSFNQSIKSNGRPDVLDNVALRPDSVLAR
jgi:hypothetical protein